LHVALVPDSPDGIARWAAARGVPSCDGHRAGIEAMRRVLRAAPDLGIGVLSIHALSCDDRQRPASEVHAILACIGSFLELEGPTCVRAGVRVTVLGRRDRLAGEVRRAIEDTERATAEGTRLELRIAIDYSARGAILAALVAGIAGPRLAGEPEARLGPDVDLLIRAGGERRLGDFLLWECAHAELLFVDTPWPDFGERELAAAVAEFRRRQRRFGSLPRTPGARPGNRPGGSAVAGSRAQPPPAPAAQPPPPSGAQPPPPSGAQPPSPSGAQPPSPSRAQPPWASGAVA
jgi:undecaprenyl diphosphate synthase